MKKVKKIFVIFILLLTKNINVQADTNFELSGSNSGYYYVIKGDNYYDSNSFLYYKINNKTVYSIEPTKGIFTNRYIEYDGIFNSLYSEEIIKKLELIGYYGYGYNNHYTNNYRIATQELIWELVSDVEVDFYTQYYGKGNKINVEEEKEEIMNLVNNHYVKPSFIDNKVLGNLGDEIILTDINNVLSEYEVYDMGENEVIQEDNNLIIKLTSYGESEIKLRKKVYDDLNTTIYVPLNTGSPKVGLFRMSDRNECLIKIKTVGEKVKIINVDSESKERIKIKGIKFKIKNLNTNEYVCENKECIYEPNNKGEVTTNKYLVGNYQIEQLKESNLDNYVLNNKVLKFTIDENTKTNNNFYEFNFENIRVKGKLEINKIGEKIILNDNRIDYVEIPLNNVSFGIYANKDIYVLNKIKYKKDDLIVKLTTDNNGYASIDNLELGEYYIKEISSNLNHIVDNNKYVFELKYIDKYTDLVIERIELKNYLPKSKLEFIKIDSHNNLISNLFIEIYTEEDNLVYSNYTNDVGMLLVDKLPLGKYYIKEYNSGEKIYFELNENNAVTKVINDNKEEFEVPDTLLNELNISLIVGIIFMIIGLKDYICQKLKTLKS